MNDPLTVSLPGALVPPMPVTIAVMRGDANNDAQVVAGSVSVPTQGNAVGADIGDDADVSSAERARVLYELSHELGFENFVLSHGCPLGSGVGVETLLNADGIALSPGPGVVTLLEAPADHAVGAETLSVDDVPVAVSAQAKLECGE